MKTEIRTKVTTSEYNVYILRMMGLNSKTWKCAKNMMKVHYVRLRLG